MEYLLIGLLAITSPVWLPFWILGWAVKNIYDSWLEHRPWK